MEWLKSISDGKGGFNTFKWDTGDDAMEFGLGIVKGIVLVFLFAMALPTFFIIFHPISNNRDRFHGIITTLMAAVYSLIDYSQEWFVFMIFHNTNNPNLFDLYDWLLAFNVGLGIINIFLLVFNGFFDTKPGVVLYGFTAVTMYFIWYPLASSILF